MSPSLLAGLAAVYVPMLLELRLSRSNERRLLARGAVEPARDVFRLMALAYPLAFAFMVVEGDWRGGPPAAWLAAGATAFLSGKALKYWAIATLGPRWAFRVLVPPGEALVTAGPYRWMNHPNYVGVAGELVGAWWWFGAWWTGPAATAAFLALMWRRVRVEDHALRSRPDDPGLHP